MWRYRIHINFAKDIMRVAADGVGGPVWLVSGATPHYEVIRPTRVSQGLLTSMRNRPWVVSVTEEEIP